jgi:hypothetical protein
MGDHSCYVRSKRALSIGRPRFAALVQDAISSRLLAGPWRVHRRRLVRTEIGDPRRITPGDGSPALAGDDTRDLIALLPELARTPHDLCIVFEGLDASNRAVSGDMRRFAYGDCPVAFLSLRTATSIDVTHVIGEDEEIDFEDEWEKDGDDEDSDDDDDQEGTEEEEDPGEDEEDVDDDQLSVRDLVVFIDNGPEFADLDERSHLLRFLGKHLGVLLVGERST